MSEHLIDIMFIDGVYYVFTRGEYGQPDHIVGTSKRHDTAISIVNDYYQRKDH